MRSSWELAGALLLGVVILSLTSMVEEAHAGTTITLANEFLTVRVIPGEGAALDSLVLKQTGRELAGEPTVTESLALAAGARLPLSELEFALKGKPTTSRCVLEAVLPENPQRGIRAGLHDTHQHFPQDDFTKVRLEKTYELEEGARGIRVTYCFTNTGDEPVAICPAYARNFLVRDKRRGVTVSSRDGPLPLQPKHPLYTSYFPRGRGGPVYTGSQAWIAFSRPGRKSILLNIFEPRHTSAFSVTPGSAEAVGTRIRLAAGESFRTRTWIVPLALPVQAIEGVGDGIVGSVQLSPPVKLSKADVLEGRLEDPEKIFDTSPDADLDLEDDTLEGMEKVVPKEMAAKKGYLRNKPVAATLTLTAVEALAVRVVATVRQNPGGAPLDLGEKRLSLESGTARSAKFSFVPDSVGTWILSIGLHEGEKFLGKVEKPVEVQGPSGFHLPPPPTDRAGEAYTDWGKFDPFDIHPQPTLDVQVPHVKYAKPYSRGKVRTAVVIPWQIGREAVELAQRVDLEMQCVFVGSHGFTWEQKLMPGKRSRAPIDETHAMKDALNQRPQVLIVIGTPLSWFGTDVQEEVVRQVRAGTGLVLCPAQEVPEPIQKLQGAASESVPFPGPGCVTAALGKGRICFVEARGIAASYQPQMATSELRLEQFSRAVLWAAQMEPQVGLEVKPSQLKLDNAAALGTVDVQLKNESGDAFKGSLELKARQDRAKDYPSVYGRSYCLGVMLSRPYSLLEDVASTTKAVALAPGEAKRVTLEIPRVRAGTYRMYTILKDAEGRTANWAHVPATVNTSYSLSEIVIQKKSSAKERLFGYRPEDTVHLELEFKAEGEPAKGLVAFLKGEDRTGRRIISETKPIRFQDGVAKMALESPLHGAHRRLLILRVGLEANGHVLLEERRPLLIREAPGREPRFRFVLLDNEASLPLHLTGISEQMGPYSPVLFAWYDMNVWPTGTFLEEGNKDAREREARAAAAKAVAKEAKAAMAAVTGAGDDEDGKDDLELMIEEEDEKGKKPVVRGFVRRPCFNDPEFRATKLEGIRRFASNQSQLGPQYVYFTHEYSYGSHDVCQCEHCQAAFRKRMEQQYASLDKLNETWGSRYQTWDEVCLFRVDKKLTPPPMAEWPRVIDTWQYKSTQLVDLCHEVVKAGKELSDDIQYGHIALSKMGLWIGMDFWEWSRVGNRHIMYRDVPEWQSMCGSASSQGWHSGYGRQYNPSEAQCKLWARVVDGVWGIAHFTCPGYPLARPDGRFFAGSQALFGNLKEIQRGWDELLLGYDQKDGIGIYRSTPSFRVHMMEQWQSKGGPGVKAHNTGDMDWERRVAHYVPGSARGYRQAAAHYVYHGQALEGKLGLYGHPKIIFLCYATAMSPKEAEVLTQFVRDGGTLVGGVNVATRDWHGRPLERPLLDDLFGIKHIGEYRPATGMMQDEGPTHVEFAEPVAEVSALKPLVVGPPNVQVAEGAQAKAFYEVAGKRCPAYIVNRHGKGQTVYQNFLSLHYNQNNEQKWDTETAKASGTLIRHLIQEAGVDPFAHVTYDDEPPFRCVVGRFRDGHCRYLAAVVHWGFPPAAYERIKARLQLREPRHVYDARRAEYLGHGTQFPMKFTVDKLAAVYSILPYKVKALQVTPPAQPIRQGQAAEFRVAVRTEGQEPGRHVIRVDVIGPDGRAVDVHSYNLTAKKGVGTALVHLGFNEPVGNWKLVLRDVASGVRAEQTFKVIEGDG